MLLEGTSVTGVMLTCQVCNTCVCKGSATEVSVCGAGLKVNGVNFPGMNLCVWVWDLVSCSLIGLWICVYNYHAARALVLAAISSSSSVALGELLSLEGMGLLGG